MTAPIDLPAFPIDHFPGELRALAIELAEYTQTSVDAPAMLMLGALATAVQGRIRVSGDWTEPLCLWPCVVMPSGERKTPLFDPTFGPLHDYADSQPVDEDKPPVRLTTADCTPEALGRLLLQQRGCMSIVSDEGTEIFAIAAGRYGEKPNFQIMLKGYSGSRVEIDRVGRGSLVIPRATLSVVLAVQPDGIRGLADDSRSKFQGVGLLGRFLYSIPKSRVGSRKTRVPRPNQDAVKAYRNVILGLLNLKPARELVTLDPEALDAFDGWHREVESMLAEGGALSAMRDLGNKIVGNTLRVAGLLHAADCAANHCDPTDEYIPATIIEDAVAVARYALAHALEAYRLMGAGASPEADGAARVLRWVHANAPERFSVRDLWQDVRRSFGDDMDRLYPALRFLETRHHIRQAAPEARSGPGRKPSPEYLVNPETRGGERTQNPNNRRTP